MTKITAVAKAETKLPAVPDFMAEFAGVGLESITMDDVKIPRIKLIQAMSPEINEYEDLRPGQFFHTVTETSIGREVRIVILHRSVSFILWSPRENGGGILARSLDGKTWDLPNTEFTVKIKGGSTVTWKTGPDIDRCRLTKWGSYNPADGKSQPAATRMVNLVCAFPDLPGVSPAIVTLQRTSIEAAQELGSKLTLCNPQDKLPIFGFYFRMKSVQASNKSGDTFFNYKFSSDGIVESYDEVKEYNALHKVFASKVVDLSGVEDEAPVVNLNPSHY